MFALAAIPARYALERQAWAEAATLEPRPSRLPQADGHDLVRSRPRRRAHWRPAGRPRGHRRARSSSRPGLTEAGETYWAEQVAIQRLGASAWLAFTEGRTEEALDEMRAAADLEDGTEKSAVTPGPLAPAREQLAS